MAEPTPMPWRVHALYLAEIYATVDEKRMQVADICGAGTQETDEANAAFIVKAVNAHDNLVKALEQALRQWKMHAEMNEQGEFDIETDVSFEGDAFRECRAILTSIKES